MSDNVVQFVPRQREHPEADCKWTDEHGVDWFRFACEYQFEGARWAFDVWARSYGDAQARIGSMGCTGVVKGQLYSEIAADNGLTVDAIVAAGGVMAQDEPDPDNPRSTEE